MVSALASRHIFVESISFLLRSLRRDISGSVVDKFLIILYVFNVFIFLYFRFILVIFSSVKEAGTQFRCSDFSFLVFVFSHLFFFLSFVQKLHLELCAFIGCYYSNYCSYWTSHLWQHSGNDLYQLPIFTIFFPSWFNFILPRKNSRIFDNFHLQLKLLYLWTFLMSYCMVRLYLQTFCFEFFLLLFVIRTPIDMSPAEGANTV